MKKLNKKGFALVETLIVAIFVMGIFTLIFTNFFPMMGEYEKRERYDDIDSVYHTYLIKKMLENNDTINNVSRSTLTDFGSSTAKLVDKNCTFYQDTDYREYCQNLFYHLGVESIYITSYKLSTLKNNPPATIDSGMLEYLLSLPDYSNDTTYNYRIIVQYKHIINNEDTTQDNYYYSYSTIGVDL